MPNYYDNPTQFLAPQWQNAGVLDSAANFLYQILGKDTPFKRAQQHNKQLDQFFASPEGLELAKRFGLPQGNFNAGGMTGFGLASTAGQQGFGADIAQQQARTAGFGADTAQMNTEFQKAQGGVPTSVLAAGLNNPFLGQSLFNQIFGLKDTQDNALLQLLNDFQNQQTPPPSPSAPAQPTPAQENLGRSASRAGEAFQTGGIPGMMTEPSTYRVPLDLMNRGLDYVEPVGRGIESFIQKLLFGPRTVNTIKQGEIGEPGKPLPIYGPPKPQQTSMAPSLSPDQLQQMAAIFKRFGGGRLG